MLLQPNFHSVRRRSGRLGRLRGRKSLILGEARARSTEIVTKPGLASFWYRSPVFIRKTVKRYKDKTYTNYLLVETVSTPQGPRQRTLCSLGSLPPGPKSKWPGLIGRVEAALLGQTSLESQDPFTWAIRCGDVSGSTTFCWMSAFHPRLGGSPRSWC